MAKIIVNNKYEINNVYVNDHYVMMECYVRTPTDKEISTIARFEEYRGTIQIIEGYNSWTTKGKFKEIDINPKTGSIDFLIDNDEQIIIKEIKS